MHERVTVRMPEEQLEDIDRLVDKGVYPNRSEAIRDGVREITGAVESTPEYLTQDSDTTADRVNAQSDD